MSTQKWFLPFAFLIGILCWGTTWRIILQTKSVLGVTTDLSASQIISLTNLKRQEAGLKPVSPNDALTASAQDKLNDMVEKSYFAHLDSTGVGSWRFIDNHGYRYYYAGENLARNFPSSLAVVEAWMSSPAHRNNLLNPNYTHIGVAVLQNGSDQYVVQLLASPIPSGEIVPADQDRPFAYSIPLVGKQYWTDNYFFSSLILSLAIVIALGIFAWPLGKRLSHVGFRWLTRQKQS